MPEVTKSKPNCVLSLVICLTASQAGFFTQPLLAREQWQMQHPSGPAPTGPITAGSYSNSIIDPNKPQINQGVPGLSGSSNGPSSFAPGLVAAPNMQRGNNRMPPPELIQQIIATRLPAGTVLTGVMADDLSSKKSLPQDLFSIVLTDGYFRNGVEVIPPNSRIVGTVVAVAPAKTLRGVGTPGNLQVGLTTLIFPDGRSCKFSGFIDRNPHHDLLEPPKVRTSSMNWGDYKRDVSSFFGSFGSGLGVVRKARDRGPDFALKAGTLVPIKLSSGLDISRMTAPTVANPVVPAAASSQIPAPALTDPFASGLNTGQPIVKSNNGGAPVLPVDLPDPF